MTPETLLDHDPITDTHGKPTQECWAVYAGEYKTLNKSAYLQAGQFIPVWQEQPNTLWRAVTPFRLSVLSAYVLGGRYIVKGGNRNDLESHPWIAEWENDTNPPIKGLGAELRRPGGIHRVTASDKWPTLVAENDYYESRKIPAPVFHRAAQNCELFSGCPIEIVARSDKTPRTLSFAPRVMYDVVRKEMTTGYNLKLPVVTSDTTTNLIKEHPRWIDALYEFIRYYGITEIGVFYNNSKKSIVESISYSKPHEVYRNAIQTGDLGFATLDHDIYERMLPFMNGKLDFESLPGD